MKKEGEYFNRRISLAKISLDLDSYNDLFSGFDPRPYHERSLSDDFLLEAKKASIDKVSGKIELNFLIPHKKRNEKEELVIKKRLRAHFKKHYLLAKQELGHIRKEGISYALIGMLLMLIATSIIFHYTEESFLVSFLKILLEPAGWFLFWQGLDIAVFKARERKPELIFYEKMHKSQINFHSHAR